MDPALEAISRGRQARTDGELAAARAEYVAAAELYRERGDKLAYAHAIRHVADMWQQELKPAKAKPLYEEALALYRSDLHTKVLDLANTVRPYALLQESEGDLEAAGRLWTEAKQLCASLRLEAGDAECEAHLKALQRTLRGGDARAVPVIKTSDLERSVQFYTGVLGFEHRWPSERDRESENGVANLLRDGAEVQLSRHAGDGAFGSLVRMFVKDVDACYEAFRKNGLDTTQRPESPIHTAPVDQTWGLREFAVRDPDGNNLCFCAPTRASL